MSGSTKPVPGFEEYSGPVGHERKLHQTHFKGIAIKLRDTGAGDFEWIRIGPGKYKRVRKHFGAPNWAEALDVSK